ncbi:MAG: DUF1841 family protein [Casimicrobiaceae bacterium]
MFTPSRDEARQFLIESWRKHTAGEARSALETIAAEIIAMHPEYHTVLQSPLRHAHRDYHPEVGEMNPFLHLSLHLAVAEQMAIDQPPGLRDHFTRIAAARGDEHAALHAVVECLGEVIWHAQRHRLPPDGSLYLACLERQR